MSLSDMPLKSLHRKRKKVPALSLEDGSRFLPQNAMCRFCEDCAIFPAGGTRFAAVSIPERGEDENHLEWESQSSHITARSQFSP